MKSVQIDQLLEQHKLDVILFFRPDELVMSINYYPILGASFLLCFKSHSILYIPASEPTPCVPNNCQVKTYPFGCLGVDPWQALVVAIKEDLAKLNLNGGKISYIYDITSSALSASHGETMPINITTVDCLVAQLPLSYQNIDQALIALYEIKNDLQIQSLRNVHQVSKIAMDTFFSAAKAGVSEGALAGLVELAITKQMNLTDKQYVSGWCYIQSGRRSADACRYSLSSGKLINEGDVVLMELAICVNGYWADITRTTSVGTPSPQVKKVFDVVKTAQQLAISAMKPGVAMANIDKIARDYITAQNIGDFPHALGHQVGFRYHDPNAGLNPSSLGVLKEGMVLTVEPGVYNSELGVGIRIEDNILITEDSATILSHSSSSGY